MRITLSQFRERINEPDLYRWLAEGYQNKILYIPKPVSENLVLVRALLLKKIRAVRIHEDYNISFSYITVVKKNLHRLSRQEKVFNALVDKIGHKQKRAIVLHLVKTCPGCSVYFKYKRPKLNAFIIRQHLDGRSVAEILADFESYALQPYENRQKITCTKKYVQHIIREYEKVFNLLYTPKRLRRTSILC